ncbi:unnamed protein product [Nippostrongylus brasiliensis]|uniref:Acetylcholine receptor subunit beta-type unc-29 (inferred by orthology to a C. elegans protein) n=1 Tax=Nippostrongylus brasiliensis TaxID=27835 RepID=A0A158QZG9_NIPBR|nr:unnamed protein product [Nippostrongylus brasiliensis]
MRPCLMVPWLVCGLLGNAFASDDEERLLVDVFRGYNSLIQPIRNTSDMPIIVKIALQLVLLINVDEKDQVMHTNVWLTLKWHDFQMRWNPVNYGEIKELRVSPERVWLPDIVLFNNADGNYEVSFMCNVVINNHGDMLWVPPAIYKSSCIIDVEFFPFDEQVCTLVFGSWTYNENEIKLEFEQAEWVDLSEYAPSSIWDVIDAPASLVNKRSRIEFQLRIRRKTLFYTTVLIIPTVLMAFISISVFFLPTDSGEKITLTTYVLLSIVVFLLLVSKILPPTSSTIPYLLLTFVLNVITILVTVVVIDVYFRAPTTHRMPLWTRNLFLQWLPLVLCMQRPKSMLRKMTTKGNKGLTQLPGIGQFSVNPAAHHPACPSADYRRTSSVVKTDATAIHCDPFSAAYYPLSPEALLAIDAIEYITEHLRRDEEYKMYRDDWKYVAMILDRLLLYIFFGITLGGTCGILFSAPPSGVAVDQPPPRLSSITADLSLFNLLASDDEERLMVDVFRGYNSLIQPIRNLTETPVIVKVALQLVLLINVDEKDQVMHTNVWLTLKWHDFQMRWNPVNYGEIKEMRVSPEKVWLPDIVLFNNADGNYEVSFMCNVVINYHGDMLWVPPAIYKSSCIIDVEFFPFDEQVCTLVFGSWTYNENEIKLEFEQAEWVDLSEYAPSSIWDLMDAPASLVNKRSRIEFQVRIRRKTLFYTVVLIIPTVLMAFLSMAVFFLPTDSGEKMTLTISVLLSIVVFLLLVSKILPPTYLLLTFVLNVITILVTVIIINVYFRGPTTHRMPKWVRKLFLEWMPFVMCMQRPKSASRKLLMASQKRGVAQLPGLGQFTFNPSTHHPLCPSADDRTASTKVFNFSTDIPRDSATSMYYPLSPDALRAIDAIEYITDHLRQDEEYKMYRDDWKYVAMIIDRLLLYVFFGITVGGTIGILFSAPYVFQGVNQREVLQKLIDLYKTRGSG